MRRFIATSALLGALLLALAVTATPQSRGMGNVEAITQDELMVYDYFLAADQLEGRNVPSRGYDTAALYIASHLKEWGLKPIVPSDAIAKPGTNADPLRPYLMPFELVSNQADAPNMKLTLTAPLAAGRGGRGGAGGGGRGAGAPAGPRAFEYARDWAVGGGGGRGGPAIEPVDIVDAPLVFVGNGYVINKTNTDPYKGIDVRGKVIVVAGLPAELAAAQAAAASAAGGRGGAGGGRGRGAANPLGVENTDYVTPQGYAAKNGARAVVMVANFQQLASLSGANAGGRGIGPNGPPYQVVKFQTSRGPSVPVITAGVDLTNAIFQNEKLSGSQVFEGATASVKLDSFELNADKKISLRTAVNSDHATTENVVGVIEGSDPVLKNEYVVFSGHLDHLGLGAPDANGDRVYNGADDDASGSSALMAMAHAYATGVAKGIRPKRTIVFAWVAGEEKGLWGSQYFNQFPPIDLTKVVADLNLDMIGRTKTPGYVDPPADKLVDPGEVFVVGPNISSDDLEKTLETVNNGYLKLKINHFYDVTAPDATHDNLGPGPQGQRIFYRSDHYNFAKMGIPIAFFTTGIHVDYHRVTDSPEKIDFVTMHKVTKTVAATGWVLANSATRPKLNAKLPDQLVNDMKAAQAAGWGKLTRVTTPPTAPY